MLVDAWRYGSYGSFPVIHSTATSKTAADTTHTITLPGGIQTGDLLLAISAVDGTPTISAYTSGWTSPGFSSTNTGLTSVTRYRIADGTEGSTISFTTSATQASVSCVLQIGNWYGSGAPEVDTESSAGAQSTYNPAAYTTPAWGSDDTLWVSAVVMDGLSYPTVWPTDFDYLQISEDSGGASDADDVSIAICARQFTGSSVNPTAYTFSATKVRLGARIAIRPI